MSKIIFLTAFSFLSIGSTYAAFFSDFEVIQPTDPAELIMLASYEGNLEDVQRSLAQLDINNDEHLKAIHTALVQACMKGSVAIHVVRLLLSHQNINVNFRTKSNDMSALDATVIQNSKELSYLLLNHGADWARKYDRIGVTPLEQEARRRGVPFIAQWLQLRERLFNAVKESDCNAIITLAQEGIALSIKDDEGNTPLHLAILGNKNKVVKTLVTLNPELANIKNNAGLNCFELAFQKGNRVIALMLLCNTTQPTRILESLMHALANNKFDMIKFFMKAGNK